MNKRHYMQGNGDVKGDKLAPRNYAARASCTASVNLPACSVSAVQLPSATQSWRTNALPTAHGHRAGADKRTGVLQVDTAGGHQLQMGQRSKHVFEVGGAEPGCREDLNDCPRPLPTRSESQSA